MCSVCSVAFLLAAAGLLRANLSQRLTIEGLAARMAMSPRKKRTSG